MHNDRRRLWTSIIFFGLFAPFVVLLVLEYLTSHKLPLRAVGASMAPAPATDSAPATTRAAVSVAAPAYIPSDSLLAAGDGRELWLVHPVPSEQGFELLRRSADTGVWLAARRAIPAGGSIPFWTAPTMPQALAVMQTPPSHPGASTPYVMGEAKAEIPGATDPAGWVSSFTLEQGYVSKDTLPAGHTIKAVVGSADQLFVITLGPQVALTQPGEPLHAEGIGAARAAATPMVASAPAPTSTRGVMTAAAAPAAPLYFNTFWFPPGPPATKPASLPADALLPARGEWCVLTPLGPAADDPTVLPKSSSQMALVEQDGRLMVFWADPAKAPAAIMLRTLEYAHQLQQWSAPHRIDVGEEIPSETRLSALWLDKALYLLWTVPTGSSRAIHGGWLDLRGGDPALHAIKAMPLDSAGTALRAGDVALGPSENAIVAVVRDHEGTLRQLTFDDKGNPLASVRQVIVESPGRDLQTGQSIAMVLLAVLLLLALWQWRQKPMPLAIPKGMIVAPLHLRALAFGIDAVLPYAAVLLITRNTDNGYFAMLQGWISQLATPEELVKSKDLLMFLGIYLGHVALGELFFRRSVGKSLAGLEVRMIDGKMPTVPAILVRNLVRVPECVLGVVLLYVLLSNRRQRLGDLLARTIVLAQAPEEAPADDTEKKKP